MVKSAVVNTIITAMMFVIDYKSLTRDTGKQIDWSLVGDQYLRASSKVTVNAIAAVDATSITVLALANPIELGTVLKFGAKKFAKVTARALAGATTITVEALPTALAVNDVAYYPFQFGDSQNLSAKSIPAGTAMVFVASTRKIVPRVNRPGSETATMVLLTDANSDSNTDSLTGYGVTYSGVMYENYMPDFTLNSSLWATIKTELGSNFIFRTATDSRSV